MTNHGFPEVKQLLLETVIPYIQRCCAPDGVTAEIKHLIPKSQLRPELEETLRIMFGRVLVHHARADDIQSFILDLSHHREPSPAHSLTFIDCQLLLAWCEHATTSVTSEEPILGNARVPGSVMYLLQSMFVELDLRPLIYRSQILLLEEFLDNWCGKYKEPTRLTMKEDCCLTVNWYTSFVDLVKDTCPSLRDRLGKLGLLIWNHLFMHYGGPVENNVLQLVGNIGDYLALQRDFFQPQVLDYMKTQQMMLASNDKVRTVSSYLIHSTMGLKFYLYFDLAPLVEQDSHPSPTGVAEIHSKRQRMENEEDEVSEALDILDSYDELDLFG